MRILILGVGAIGSTFLAFLTRAGYSVQGLLREGTEPIGELEIKGIWGEFRVRVNTTPRVEQLQPPQLLILSVKSYDTESALLRVKDLISEGTYILIAQNGYGNYEIAAEMFGEEKVLLSRIIFGAKREGRNRVRITVSADDVVIGSPSGKAPESEVRSIVEIINSAGIPTRYERDVYKFLWDKIIYNCALNPLGALLEVNYGYLASCEETNKLMKGIIREIFAVSHMKGIETFWRSAEDYIDHFYRKLIPPTAEHYPSMLEDIRRGKTEIDALNGAIVKLASELGIEVPINRTITELVKAKEKLLSHQSEDSPSG
jgi:2-dehydropantoate 2-reductase